MGLDRVSWKELEPEFLQKWGWPKGKFQGEHLAIVGPTGSGKSVFQNHVVKQRAEIRGSHVYILATKPADSEMKKLGWPIIEKWPPPYGSHEHVIFWPKANKMLDGSMAAQRIKIAEFLDDVWRENANCIIVFDEIAYLEEELRLQKITNRYWREARTQGISMVAGTQRPRNVGRNMWSMASWSVAFRPDDEDDAGRVAEILGGRNRYRDELLGLKRHEFIIVERRERNAYISRIGS
jgi:hypothetical protein